MLLSIPCRALACLLSFAFISSFTLLAADPAMSRTVTLAECLRRVSERSPELKAGVYKTEAADNRAKQAARRLNPRLQTEIETVTGSGEAEGFKAAESTVSLSQEIELGDKRRHRTAAAQADAAVSRAEEGVKRRELLFDTRRAVLAVLNAQEQVRLAEEILALVRETESVVLAREQGGKTTGMETERARTDTARAALDVQERQAEQQDSVRELALLWGETDPTFDAVAGTLDIPAAAMPSVDTLVLQAAANPALLAADSQTRAFEAKLRSEEAARLPNLEVAAGVRRLEASDGFGLIAGVGFELPLVNRNREAVRAAAADAEAARLESAAARLQNEGQLRRLYARLQALAAKNARLRETAIPSAERVLALVKQAHEQGKAGYLDVLEARRTLAEARRSVSDAAIDFHSCRIELDRLSASTAENHTDD
jgi:cobalt-zinc-cadmium efflux system outer membrane protein